MGYIRHTVLVVTSYDEWDFEPESDRAGYYNTSALYARAVAMCGSSLVGGLVSPIVPALANGYSTFMIAPHGSKAGWRTAAEAADNRGAFVEFLRSKCHGVDWVEVQFGGDGGRARITGDCEDPELECGGY